MFYLFWRVGLSSGIYSVNILLVYFLALGFILLTLLCSLHPPPPFFLQGAFLLTTIKEHQPWFSFFWGLFPLYFKKPFYDKITKSSIFFWVILLMLLQSTIYKGYYVKHSCAGCILQNNMLLPLSFFLFIFIAGKYVLCIFFF